MGQSHKITFSETGYGVGATNPIYSFSDNIVSFTGVVVTDVARPVNQLALAANSSYIGPVFIKFGIPVLTASLDVGYIDKPGSTEVQFVGSDGSILADFYTTTAGFDPISYTAPGNVLISSINVLAKKPDTNGFAVDTIAFTDLGTLFTSNSDTVDFNNLTSVQMLEIRAGSNKFNGLGSNDQVFLPSTANFNESVGGGQTLGWTNTSASTFYTKSKPGDSYYVSGGDGSYYIVAGAGNDVITINGTGSSHISAGTGNDTISIRGGGYAVVSNTSNFNGSAFVGSRSILEIQNPGLDSITFDPVESVANTVVSGGTLILDDAQFVGGIRGIGASLGSRSHLTPGSRTHSADPKKSESPRWR